MKTQTSKCQTSRHAVPAPGRIALILALILALHFAPATVRALNVPGTTVIEWSFDQAGDFEGWAASGDVSGVAVADGALSLTIGAGPGRIVGPVISVNPAGVIAEIRLKSTAPGPGILYYTNKLTGGYDGFEADWRADFTVQGGPDFQTIQVLPGWSQMNPLVRIRFNLPSSASLAIDRIRLLKVASSPGAPPAFWQFDTPGEPAAWSADHGVAGLAVAGGRLGFDVTGYEGEVQSGAIRHTATKADFASFRMSASVGRLGVVVWYSLEGGQGEQWFRLRSDGQMHTYNVELNNGAWRETVVAVGLRLVDAQGAHVELDSFLINSEPDGPADLEILGLHPADGLARAGRPATLFAMLRNQGSQALDRATATLEWSPADAVRLVATPATQPLAKKEFGRQPERLEWRVAAERAGEVRFTVRARAANAPEQTLERTVAFTAPRPITPADYVPEPQPLETPYLIGAYYMPAWSENQRWQRYSLDEFPARIPALGAYDDTDPAVADWHIKWAVEHGVNVMLYDWFWEAGNISMEGSIRAFLKARYRDRMKFALLWANHFEQPAPYEETFLRTIDYWIDHFFKQPEHLLIDGKPAVFVFAPSRLKTGLAGGLAAGLDAARARARERGLAGIYFIACGPQDGPAAQAFMDEGYDAVSTYAYAWAGSQGRTCFPYADMVRGYSETWDSVAGTGAPYMVPIMPGWDNTPQGNHHVTWGYDPAQFETMCRNAKAFIDGYEPGRPTPKMLVVKAWNEFPEGSQLEPNVEFGFGNLDAVARVFGGVETCERNVIPADFGLGPYEPHYDLGRSQWTFDDNQPAGWYTDVTDPTRLAVADGRVTVTSPRGTVILGSPPLELGAAAHDALVLRIRPTNLTQITVRWLCGHETGPSHALWANNTNVKIESGPEFRTVTIPLAGHPRWRGHVRWLELRAAGSGGTEFELDSIRFTQPARARLASD